MKEVITKILIVGGIVTIFLIFIFKGTLVTSNDGNKKLDVIFSESILP